MTITYHLITLDFSNLFPPYTHAKICIGVTPFCLCVCVFKRQSKTCAYLLLCSTRFVRLATRKNDMGFACRRFRELLRTNLFGSLDWATKEPFFNAQTGWHELSECAYKDMLIRANSTLNTRRSSTESCSQVSGMKFKK